MEIFTKYSLWLIVPIIIASAALSFYLYYKDKKLEKINTAVLYMLFFLRFSVLSVLGFLLLMPIVKHYSIFLDKPLIIIAQDNSESVGLTNSIDNCKPDDYKENTLNLYNDLSGKYKVKFYTFGDQIKDSLDYQFSEKETDFTSVFNLIDKKYANYNIGALVLASDGIYNKGSNPVHIAKKFTFPVYTVALGDTSQKRDLILRSVNTNRIAFLNDIFPVEIIFNAFGYAGKSASIRIIHKGKTINSKTIKIDNNDFAKQLDFEINASEKSLQRYTVAVDIKQDEFSKRNNQKQFVVDVVDDKKKILILYNSVHPDIGAIKSAIKTNKNIQIESIPFNKFNTNKLTDYQMIILHQLPSSTHDIRQLAKKIYSKKIPVLYMFGNQTDINRFDALNIGIIIKANKKISELALPEINQGFQLFENDKQFTDLIGECAPLNTFFGNYTIGKEFDILLKQNIKGISTNKALLAFSNPIYSQGSKQAVLFGEGIWKWRITDYLLNENHEQFDAFINRIVQFLALDIKKERFMVYNKNIAYENEELIIRAELYNQSYELYNKADVFLELKNEKNKLYKFSFSKSGQAYSINIGKLPKGNYTFTAHTIFEGKKYKKTGKISIIPLNIEEQNLRANHLLLRQLSEQSGGALYYPKQYQTLANDLKNNKSIKAVSHSTIDLVDLIQLKWLLLILIIFLSIEWFVRKFFGA